MRRYRSYVGFSDVERAGQALLRNIQLNPWKQLYAKIVVVIDIADIAADWAYIAIQERNVTVRKRIGQDWRQSRCSVFLSIAGRISLLHQWCRSFQKRPSQLHNC